MNNQKKNKGHSKIKFYHSEEVVRMLKEELKEDSPSTGKMFSTAMQYSNSDNSTRVPDFNAQYAFSRSLLTTMIIVSFILLVQYYTQFIAWFILIPLFISWYRYKDRDYYYAREVLLVYLHKKKQAEIATNL